MGGQGFSYQRERKGDGEGECVTLSSWRFSSLPPHGASPARMGWWGGQGAGKETRERRSLRSVGSLRKRETNDLLPSWVCSARSLQSYAARFGK